jgi:hypothetical protein
MVGGTGRDDLYGGQRRPDERRRRPRTGSLNDTTDSHPTYEDRVTAAPASTS